MLQLNGNTGLSRQDKYSFIWLFISLQMYLVIGLLYVESSMFDNIMKAN